MERTVLGRPFGSAVVLALSDVHRDRDVSFGPPVIRAAVSAAVVMLDSKLRDSSFDMRRTQYLASY